MRLTNRPVRAREATDGRPLAFVWRGHRYGPLVVVDEWCYTEPWWEGEQTGGVSGGVDAGTRGGAGGRERRFFRVDAGGKRFDLCREPGGAWRLHRIFD